MDKPIINCRLCSCNKLEKIFNFGSLALGNNLQNSFQETLKISKYPLELQKCAKCSHFQLTYSVDPTILYATNYTYLSSIGLSFVEHISEFVKWICKKCKISKSKFILEIGSNDGTCLKEFQKIGCKVCGVDPAKIPAKIANKNGIYTINNFFNDEVKNEVLKKFGKPFLITSQNALAHIDDLIGTFKRVYNLLEDDGYFVFEVGYFLSVLENNLFDTIYHEHLDYHHALPLVKHLRELGFQVLSIVRVNSQGGSLRLLVRKSQTKIFCKEVEELLSKESKSLLYNRRFIDSWLNNIKSQLNKVKNVLNNKKSTGYQIIGFGAPTKATLLLNLTNLGKDDIDFIVEDNKLKVGKFLPNGIQIKTVNDIQQKSKILILILAWNFSDDIIYKLKKLGIKCEVIIPLPTFRKITI